MPVNLNERLNGLLNNERIQKEKFDDLKNVAIFTNFDENVLRWFRYLQDFEITGWRNKQTTRNICKILQSSEPIKFYSLFCPSYKKGEGVAGFRTDDVGNTTKIGLKKLVEIAEITEKFGFKCEEPEAIFFDLALEQPEKTTFMLDDLKKNIENFCKYVPGNMKFSILSKKFPELVDIIGYMGVVTDPILVDKNVLDRVIERGKKFYELFGWSAEKIIKRSKVIVSSESIVGTFIRYRMPNSIMLYTPTMLERAQIYSGRYQDDPLAILFPKKDV